MSFSLKLSEAQWGKDIPIDADNVFEGLLFMFSFYVDFGFWNL